MLSIRVRNWCIRSACTSEIKWYLVPPKNLTNQFIFQLQSHPTQKGFMVYNYENPRGGKSHTWAPLRCSCKENSNRTVHCTGCMPAQPIIFKCIAAIKSKILWGGWGMNILYFPVFLMWKKVTAGNVLTSLPVHAANKLSLPAVFFYAKTAFAYYQERICIFVHQTIYIIKRVNRVPFSKYNCLYK